MEINDIYKIQSLLKTATERFNEALALAIPPAEEPRKCKIYVTQQSAKGVNGYEGWSTLFADTDPDKANEWVNSHNSQNDNIPTKYRVITIDLYLD